MAKQVAHEISIVSNDGTNRAQHLYVSIDAVPEKQFDGTESFIPKSTRRLTLFGQCGLSQSGYISGKFLLLQTA